MFDSIYQNIFSVLVSQFAKKLSDHALKWFKIKCSYEIMLLIIYCTNAFTLLFFKILTLVYFLDFIYSLTEDCKDDNDNCALWARYNQCTENPSYMLEYCKYSCGQCSNTIMQSKSTAPSIVVIFMSLARPRIFKP